MTEDKELIIAVNPSIGEVANLAARKTLLDDYQDRKATQTLRRQKADIALFERFLNAAGYPAQNMAADLSPWSVVTWGLVEAFNRWQLQEGYAIGSIGVRLATIKTYCKLAAKAGYLNTQEYALITTIEGYSNKEASHVDEKRVKASLPTRKSTKKPRPTPLKPEHVELLKQQTDNRDRLIICLLFDHALRCGEVALLDVNDIELDPALQTGFIYITSEKTEGRQSTKQKARLTPDTYHAATDYLAECRHQGPLFIGKISGKRIDTRSVHHRVKVLGRRIGLKLDISPHDGRHFYADDGLDPENKNSLADVQKGGRWRSPVMVLRYATDREVINENLTLTATRKKDA